MNQIDQMTQALLGKTPSAADMPSQPTEKQMSPNLGGMLGGADVGGNSGGGGGGAGNSAAIVQLLQGLGPMGFNPSQMGMPGPTPGDTASPGSFSPGAEANPTQPPVTSY